MEQLTLKELNELFLLVKRQKARHMETCLKSSYCGKLDADCPEFIVYARERASELSFIQKKLERMIAEAE